MIVSDGSGQSSIPCLFCTKYGRFDFFNNFIYLKYNYKKTELLDFYFTFGIGASSIRYRLQDTMISTINPITLYEIGWQGLKFGKYFIRVALRGNIINEKETVLFQGGTEISLGRSF